MSVTWRLPTAQALAAELRKNWPDMLGAVAIPVPPLAMGTVPVKEMFGVVPPLEDKGLEAVTLVTPADPVDAAVSRPFASTVILAFEYEPGTTPVLPSVRVPLLARVASPPNAVETHCIPLPIRKLPAVGVVEPKLAPLILATVAFATVPLRSPPTPTAVALLIPRKVR